MKKYISLSRTKKTYPMILPSWPLEHCIQLHLKVRLLSKKKNELAFKLMGTSVPFPAQLTDIHYITFPITMIRNCYTRELQVGLLQDRYGWSRVVLTIYLVPFVLEAAGSDRKQVRDSDASPFFGPVGLSFRILGLSFVASASPRPHGQGMSGLRIICITQSFFTIPTWAWPLFFFLISWPLIATVVRQA